MHRLMVRQESSRQELSFECLAIHQFGLVVKLCSFEAEDLHKQLFFNCSHQVKVN